jgi:hypothetical protein
VGSPQLLPDGFGRLGRALQVLVGLCGISSIVGFGFELWASVVLGSAVNNFDPAERALNTYGQLGAYYAGASSLLMLGAGVIWLAWQHRLATAVPRATLRRSPGWHIASWLIPVVNLWFPFQNILNLRQAVASGSEARRTPRSYRLWWGFWIGNTVVQNVATLGTGPGGLTVASAARGASIATFAEALNVGAAACAILVVGDLTARAVQAREDAVAAAAQR